MTLDALSDLVRGAEQACEAMTCEKHGHAWETDGARQCPRSGARNGWGCSQACYVCRRCGEVDYGETGGPGHADCSDERRCDGTFECDDEVDEA
jgi:hypothetical protein